MSSRACRHQGSSFVSVDREMAMVAIPTLERELQFYLVYILLPQQALAAIGTMIYAHTDDLLRGMRRDDIAAYQRQSAMCGMYITRLCVQLMWDSVAWPLCMVVYGMCVTVGRPLYRQKKQANDQAHRRKRASRCSRNRET